MRPVRPPLPGPAGACRRRCGRLPPRAGLHVAQHGRHQDGAAGVQQLAEARLRRLAGRMPGRLGHAHASGEGLVQEEGTVFALQDVAHRGAHQAGHGRERGQAAELLPQLQPDVRRQHGLHRRRAEQAAEFLEPAQPLRSRLRQHAEHDPVQRGQVQHFACRRQARRNGGAAGNHPRRAETGLQGFDVRDAVEQRQHEGAGPHGRADGLHGRREIVGLAGEQHQIVGRQQFGLQDRAHRDLEVTVGAAYHQALGAQLRRAPLAHEEAEVGPGLHEPAAKIAADRAGAQHEDLHARHSAPSDCAHAPPQG